jgi:hypothetical protein
MHALAEKNENYVCALSKIKQSAYEWGSNLCIQTQKKGPFKKKTVLKILIQY